MLGYIISCIILGLLLLGYIPAMIAASKNHSFIRWYVFGMLIFPLAFIRAVKLRKPVRIINVHTSSNISSRKKKSYRYIPAKKKDGRISPLYLIAVLATKFIFSAFLALVAFAIMRLYTPNTVHLRTVCVIFAIFNTGLMAVTEIFRFSRLPIMADEVTKRALQMLAISALASLPMFCLKNIITSNITSYRQFVRFICTLMSFIIFVALVFKLQTRYYGRFSRFFDYCVLSLCAYAVYAAITLVTLSFSKILPFSIYPFAMQMQIFNFSYFADVKGIVNMSSIYLGATVHLIIAILLLFSGIRCNAFKKKELAFRVEYRSKAFRTSQKRALYRHIPKTRALAKAK